MKKLFLLFFSLLLLSPAIPAQTVRLGVAQQGSKGELASTDPVNGKQHFKTWPVPLKKGWGVVFFMQSSSFTPFTVLANSEGDFFGEKNLKDIPGGKEARVSFKAPADTSVTVIFSSAEDNKTGSFSFGYRILDSSQMQFNENY